MRSTIILLAFLGTLLACPPAPASQVASELTQQNAEHISQLFEKISSLKTEQKNTLSTHNAAIDLKLDKIRFENTIQNNYMDKILNTISIVLGVAAFLGVVFAFNIYGKSKHELEKVKFLAESTLKSLEESSKLAAQETTQKVENEYKAFIEKLAQLKANAEKKSKEHLDGYQTDREIPQPRGQEQVTISAEAKKLETEGTKAFYNGDWETAFNKFHALAEQAPTADNFIKVAMAAQYFGLNHSSPQKAAKALETSIDFYERASEISPLLPAETYSNWGAAYGDLAKISPDEKKGNYLSKSIACFISALKLSPNDATVQNNLGTAYYKMDALSDSPTLYLDKAKELFKSVLLTEPDNLHALRNLAHIYYKQAQSTIHLAKKEQYIQRAKEKLLKVEEVLPGVAAYQLATLTVGSSDPTEYQHWLNTASLTDRLPPIDDVLKNPAFEKVRDTKWFNNFIRRFRPEEPDTDI